MEPNEEFAGVAGWGVGLSSHSPGHVGLFNCDRDTTDTICLRSKARMFCGNRGPFHDGRRSWNKAPGPPGSRVSVSGGHPYRNTPTVVGIFSRAPRGARVALTRTRHLKASVGLPHLLFG